MEDKIKRYCELKEQEKAIQKEMEPLAEEIKAHFETFEEGVARETQTDTHRVFVNKKVTGWIYSDKLNQEAAALKEKQVDEQEQEIATPKYSVALNIKALA